MAKGDIFAASITALAVAAGFLLSGPVAGCVFLIIGIVFLVSYFQHEETSFATLNLVPSEHLQNAPATEKPSSLKVTLEDAKIGLRRAGMWQGKTFLFCQCGMVSSAKTTSIVKIVPTVFTSNGEQWAGTLVEDLSDWNLSSEGKSDVDLESLSLWRKLKENPLTKEIATSGWLGITVYRNSTASQLATINRIDLAIEDGGGQRYSIPLQLVSKKDDSLIVAKHLNSASAH